jgi:hypothetical protein
MKPEPLTPPDCDLRDFSWMPLDVIRLRDSDLAVIVSGDAFRAAVLLWCASWHQVPAASLPMDDRLLANLAGYGRDMKGWSEVRDDALRGFVECSDGRLYHAVVAEKALEADGQRKAQRARTQKATDARRGGKRDDVRNVEHNEQNNRDVIPDVKRHDQRNEVQQTRPDQTEPDKTGPTPKPHIEKPVVVVGPEKTTTTTEAKKTASQGKAGGLGTLLGRPLPADWVPNEATCEKVAAHFDMRISDINAELPAFHALNMQNGTLSQDWGSTFYLFAKQWRVRQARAAPARFELSKAPDKPFVPTERDWESTVKIYAQTGRWSHQFGPDPLSRACRCPPHLLRKHLPNPDAIPVLAAAKAMAS